jgi:hypothetical protein
MTIKSEINNSDNFWCKRNVIKYIKKIKYLGNNVEWLWNNCKIITIL